MEGVFSENNSLSASLRHRYSNSHSQKLTLIHAILVLTTVYYIHGERSNVVRKEEVVFMRIQEHFVSMLLTKQYQCGT